MDNREVGVVVSCVLARTQVVSGEVNSVLFSTVGTCAAAEGAARQANDHSWQRSKAVKTDGNH